MHDRGLDAQGLGTGFELGVSVMSAAVQLTLDCSTRSTARSSKLLYYMHGPLRDGRFELRAT